MFMDFVYFVPSWKMLPTSIPREMVMSLAPHSGHMPPSTIFAKSRNCASLTSRAMSSPVKWQPSSFAPATRLLAFSSEESSSTVMFSGSPTGPIKPAHSPHSAVISAG